MLFSNFQVFFHGTTRKNHEKNPVELIPFLNLRPTFTSVFMIFYIHRSIVISRIQDMFSVQTLPIHSKILPEFCTYTERTRIWAFLSRIQDFSDLHLIKFVVNRIIKPCTTKLFSFLL